MGRHLDFMCAKLNLHKNVIVTTKISRYKGIVNSGKRDCLLHTSVTWGTLGGISPLIQHCPLVLTAILHFMAAFCMCTEMLCVARRQGEHVRKQEAGGWDVEHHMQKRDLSGNLYFKYCGSRQRDACEAVENGGGVGKAGMPVSESRERRKERHSLSIFCIGWGGVSRHC